MDNAQNDVECKIAALGKNMIFVSTGVGGYDSGDPRSPVPSWRSADEARRVYDRLSNNGAHHPSVAEVAREWSRRLGKLVEVFQFLGRILRRARG